MQWGEPSLKDWVVALVVGCIAASVSPALAQRFSDAEKRALAGKPSHKFRIEIAHPEVLRTEIESTKFTPNLLGGSAAMRGWITLNVYIARPVEESVIEDIAWIARRAAAKFDSVGVRFILPAENERRDPEVGSPFYSWRLFKDDAVDVRNASGVTPNTVRGQVAALKLSDGEKLEGVWVDHNFSNGVVVLISRNAQKDMQGAFLIDPGTRYVLPQLPKPGSAPIAALTQTGELGTYKTNGEAADRIAFALRDDGALLVYAGNGQELASRPWLIGRPWISE